MDQEEGQEKKEEEDVDGTLDEEASCSSEYTEALAELEAFGFESAGSNLQALTRARGNIKAAIRILVEEEREARRAEAQCSP